MFGRSRCLLVLVLALATFPGRAEDAERAEPPYAREVLSAMSQHLAKADEFSYHAELEFDELLPGGPMVRLAGAIDVAVDRPGHLFLFYRGDWSRRVVWFQDGRLTLFDPTASLYTRVSGPKDIDGMMDKLEQDHGVIFPLGELAEADPELTIARDVDLTHYVGIHDVEGIPCHHVLLQRSDLDIQVFVQVEGEPLLRKLVLVYPDRPGSPQYTAWITEWSFEPPPAEIFEEKLPDDVAAVEFLPLDGVR